MVNAGRILILTKGDWSSLVTYEMLDLVSYDGVAYLARQASVGVNPSTDISKTYWQPFGSVSDIATTTTPGIVMPDGTTIKIGAGGLIYCEIDASNIPYDNTATGVTADDAQEAIDAAILKAQMAINGIAPIEATSTASESHAINTFFFYNSNLYQATAAIAQGATITPGTNCTQRTLSAAIATLTNGVGKAYQTDDSVESAIDSADYIPFYDSSASAKKKILVSNLSFGDSVSVGFTGTASASGVRYQRIGINGSYSEINGTKFMEQTKTLSTSADVTYTFTNAAITADSVIEPYCSIFGVSPSSITVSAGSCAIVIPKYSSAVSCKVRIYIR